MTAGRIDTNIILRFLTDEPPEQADRASRFVAAIQRGDEEVILEEVVVAEVIWTLRSFYTMTRAEIASLLLRFLAMDHILSSDKEALRVAIVLFAQRNIDFADAILVAKALQSDNPVIYSFDRDFDRIPGVIRREP